MMRVNPMQLIEMIRQGNNPQQLVMSLLQSQMGNTPMGRQLMMLAQQQDAAALEQIARNICAERGADYDNEFLAFQQLLGLRK